MTHAPLRRSLVCLLVSLALALSGCGAARTTTQDTDTLSIVTTIYPLYDWVQCVIGDTGEQNISVTWLTSNGQDLHSFQPSVDDMVQIKNCDLFIYVGGESDSWVVDTLASGAPAHVLCLFDAISDRLLVEQDIDEINHVTAPDLDISLDHLEYDEHIWLSLQNAIACVRAIEAQLSQLRPAQQDSFAKNAATYIQKLEDLDARFQDAVDAGRVQTLLFGDRYPFRYMAEDYGLTCYAAFAGCSAETEASFATIAFLASKLDELDLHAIMTVETGDGSLARTIAEAATHSVEILTLQSMQALRADDIGQESYLSLQTQNLAVLQQALQ